jgi:thiamine transporter
MMVALASVLNFIILYTLPQGGSVTLGGMVPILFLALRRGVRVGVGAGMVLSLVILSVPGQAFVVNPIQFLLDYPIAYGALGLAGFFPKRPLIGVGAGILGRFCSHFVSGVVFFASFAPTGESPVVYSAIYNGSYLLGEWFVSIIIMFMLARRNLLKVYL